MRPIVPVRWRSGAVEIFDQRALPGRESFLVCRTVNEVCDAIRSLAVRGAPILGVTAAWAMALAGSTSRARGARALLHDLQRAGERLRATRPTAVNLAWAVDRTLDLARERALGGSDADVVRGELVAEAHRIEREDREACDIIGANGAALVPDGARILTHCNTGMLCTSGIGTAQGVIFSAHRAGKRIHVWVGETRPVWQGARLTAWELGRLGIPRTLIADGAAASFMAAGQVDLVVTGADRVAADGSVANKIGTYGLAVLAGHHGIPFYVAAPMSTVDPQARTGSDIAIEERDAAEVASPLGLAVAAKGTPVANPAFDVTPPGLVSALITERGVLRKPYASALRKASGTRRSA